MKYCGWIPTVTGHLSFNTIGAATYPTKSRQLRCGKSAVFLQKRDLLDVVAPFLDNSETGKIFRELIANHILGISGKFTFVSIVSYEEDNEKMRGNVYLLPNSKYSQEIKQISSAILQDKCEDSQYKRISELVESLCENNFGSASFCLERGGKILIDTNVQSAYAEVDGKNKQIDNIIANQFYYFFKDIAHVHQHHEPSHDAIIELTRIDVKKPDAWIADVQSDLYRAIIRYKRFRNEKALFRASGILAYTKSFDNNYGNKLQEQRNFNADQLEQSLAVSRAEIQHFDQKKLAQIESTRNFFFALFGFVISASIILTMGPETEPLEVHYLLSLGTRIVASKPLHTVGTLLVIAVIYSFLTHKSDPANLTMVRTSLRWLQGFRMRYYMISNIILTMFFSIICYYTLIAGLLD